MIGEKLGSFRIESVLGTGAMGVVYKAVSETTRRAAAVKVISGEIAQRSKTYERFKREAEILQQFRHPSIVRFLAVGRYKGTSYFAMEYVHGQTLEAQLARRGPLPWRDVMHLGIQICDALHYAHEHGVVHRDLKPSNLMITAEGQVKLTDFGIAKDLDATALTATGRTLGTAAYMAPEQIRGTPEVSHKTDLYALGVVFYQMLTGQPAFEGTSAVVLMHCHLNEVPPRPSSKVPEIPVALDDLIVKLMAKSPADRPWVAAAVGVTLTELRDQLKRGEKIPMVWSPEQANSTHPTRAGAQAPKKKKRARSRGEAIWSSSNRAWVEVGLLALGLVVIGGLIGYQLWPPSEAYLYHQAKALMASENRHDWERARDHFLDPLDQRFPNNSYRKTSTAWRDQIMLATAEDRAKYLRPGVISKIHQPNNALEEHYYHYYSQATEASKNGNDLLAVVEWKKLAEILNPEDKQERPWYLLVEKHIADLEHTMVQRRKFVIDQLEQSDKALKAGRPRMALDIRSLLQKNYGRYADLADLLGSTPEEAAPQQPAPSPPGEQAPPSNAAVPPVKAAAEGGTTNP
jgi:serine/threonine-protein kinase